MPEQPQHICSIDQGTSSTRCIIFNRLGEVVAQHQREHTQYYPAPGYVEHNVEEIWESAKICISSAMEKSGLNASDLGAVGITNQRETSVVWNKKTGKPYANAIVWNDGRTEDICDRLAEDGGKDRFRATTGLPIAPYFSASKLMYFLQTIPGLREDAEAGDALFGNIDSYLIWKLTGGRVHATDVSNASRTMLMDLSTLQWCPQLLEVCDNIPRGMLPEIHPSSCLEFGSISAQDVPSLNGVQIGGVLGDQQAALFGQCCFHTGDAKATYGTGCFVLRNTGTDAVQSDHGMLTTVAYQLSSGGKKQEVVYALEGSVAYAGSLIQWLRDNLQVIANAKEAEELALTVPDSGGVYFVPAFSGLFAPYWRSDARGVIAGMTAYNTKAHIVRAALESTAFQTYKVLEAMALDCTTDDTGSPGGHVVTSLRVDGGMTSNAMLMQFQADLLHGPPLDLPSIPETTALGAAFAAGLAVGTWSDLSAIQSTWKRRLQYLPAMETEKRQKLLKGWEKAILRSLDWEETHETGRLQSTKRSDGSKGSTRYFSTYSRGASVGDLQLDVNASLARSLRHHTVTPLQQATLHFSTPPAKRTIGSNALKAARSFLKVALR